jgi:hypothetical protein
MARVKLKTRFIMPVIIIFSMIFTAGLAGAENPAGCFDVALGITLSETSGIVTEGDTLTYTVTYTNGTVNDACDAFDINTLLTLPDLSTITLTSGATLASGATLTCPSADLRCVTAGPYTYVVAHADETGPTTGCPPNRPAGNQRVTAYTDGTGLVDAVLTETVNLCKTKANPVIHVPIVETEVHDAAHNNITNGSVLLGDVVHDLAIVSGAVGTPQGTVDFTLYDNGTCDGNVISTENDVALVGGQAESSDYTTDTVGSFSYMVHYDGDSPTYEPADGPCEPFNVEPRDTVTITEVHDSLHNDITNTDVVYGEIIHDYAKVTDAITSAAITEGDVTFTLYDNGTCDGAVISTETVSLDASGEAETSTVDTATIGEGSFSFGATYNGTANFNPSSAECEPFDVVTIPTVTITEVHDSLHNDITNTDVVYGDIIHDYAKVTEQVSGNPVTEGDVTFTLYDNGTCDGAVISTETVLLDANGEAETSTVDTAIIGEGSFSFGATYNGTGKFNPSSAECEPFDVVTIPTVTITEVHDSSHNDITNTAVLLGDIVHDYAKVTEQDSGNPVTEGDVTFTLYDNGTCDGNELSTETELLDANGEAETSTVDTATIGVGSFSYKAEYNGTGKFNPSSADCEPFDVVDCEVEIDKQVSCDGSTWFDVTTNDDPAPRDGAGQLPDCSELDDQTVHARYLVKNLGTTDVECTVSDDNPLLNVVGAGTEVDIPAGGGDVLTTSFDATCNDGFETEEPNTGTVNCECFVGDTKVADRSDDDIANIECLGCDVNVDKAVSCNGEAFVDELLVKANDDGTQGCTANNTENITIQYRASNEGDVGLVNCTISESNTLIGDGVQTPFDIGIGGTSGPFTDDNQECSDELAEEEARDGGDTATVSCECVDPAGDAELEGDKIVDAWDKAIFNCVGEGCLLIFDEEAIDNDMKTIEAAADCFGVKPDWLVNDDRPTETSNPDLRWNELCAANPDSECCMVWEPTGQEDDEGVFALPPVIEYYDERPRHCHDTYEGPANYDTFVADFIAGTVPQECLVTVT